MSMKLLSISIIATLALCGCKKDESKNKTDESKPSATSVIGTAVQGTKDEAPKPTLPQPDANKPLASYPEIKSGMQIMFLYVAASRLPPDFTKLAKTYSSEYRETSDSFRKNDLMKAIQPQLEEKITEAKSIPYGWMDINSSENLGAYDFDRKGFPIGEFQSALTRYLNDADDYKLTWANQSQVAFAPVPDETVARQLESMRTKYDNSPKLKVYFFAQSADLNDQKVNAVVTRVQITDKSGRVMAEYGPDGSIAGASAKADKGCGGDPAACAAAAVTGL